MSRKRLVLLALAVTGLTAAVGSGAFSAVSAERGVQVNVVSDSEAYVGVADDLQCGAGNGTAQNKEFVTNRFATAVDATVTVTARDGELRVGPRGETVVLDTGDSAHFTFDDLGPGEDATIQVKPPRQGAIPADTLDVAVDASGSGVEAKLDAREVTVHCPEVGRSVAAEAGNGTNGTGSGAANGTGSTNG